MGEPTPPIRYIIDRRIDVGQFKDVLEQSGLAARRPVADLGRLERMLEAYNLVVTAWSEERLVGVATTWTDHAFVAYLADLAVDRAFQRQGIGRHLVELTREAVGQEVTVILLSAPDAAGYYPKIGMERFTDCFLIRRTR